MSQIVSIIPQTVSIIVQIIMKYRQSGADTASMKCLIQEEIRRTQNIENSAAMEKIVEKVLDHKHAEELHKTGLKAERYKLEAEYWKKMVEDLQQSEKSVENKLVLSCLVELLKQLKDTGHSQKYKKKTTPAQHGSGHRGNFHHRNINSNASYDQNFTQHQSFQQNIDIQQNNNFQGTPHFQQTPRFHRNSQFQKSSRFQNPNIHENPTAEQELLFQERQIVQPPRRKQSFACRGKGQRGRGQQSSSVGWNKARSELQAEDLPELQAKDLPSNQQSSHFHSQVRKVAGNENSSFKTDSLFHRGAKQYIHDHGYGNAGVDPVDNFGSGHLQFLLHNKQRIILIFFLILMLYITQTNDTNRY